MKFCTQQQILNWMNVHVIKNEKVALDRLRVRQNVFLVIYRNNVTHARKHCRIQELNYRKQIARQLRTQYVEGTYMPKYYTVNLKSRLRVTQGHWKRNHWTDHTRLTISRVI